LVRVEIYYDTLHALSLKYKYAEEKLTENITYFVHSNDIEQEINYKFDIYGNLIQITVYASQ